MKKGLVALALAVVSTSVSAQQTYTPEFIAEHLVKRDQERGIPDDQGRIEQMTAMIERAADQCRRDDTGRPAAERVADRVMLVRNQLAEQNITVTTYELLDVLYGMLGDGRSDRDCSSILALYLETRSGDASATHIYAYKMLQGLRDNGLF